MKIRKHHPLYLLIPLIFTVLCFLYKDNLENTAFNAVAKSYFENELSGDTLSLHYTLANPEKYGIPTSSPSLPIYETGNNKIRTAYLEDTLMQLEHIDTSRLTQDAYYLYTLFQKSIRCNLELEKYSYYYEPLSPNSGMHSQLLILLAEYPFYDMGDVNDYLALLGVIPAYLDSLYRYEAEKATAGLLMASSSLNKTICGCRSIISPQELEAGSHFLQETFAKRLEKLVEDGLISNETKSDLLMQNDILLTDVVAPSYENLATNLTGLYEFCSPLLGLSHSEQGKEYYVSLLRNETGSSRSIEDIERLILERLSFEEERLTFFASKETTQTLEQSYTYLTDNFPLHHPDDILRYLRLAMAEDFPPLTDVCTIDIKTVAASLDDYTAPAFYLTPPIDAYHNNIIYINESSVFPGLDNFTTLAHEGFPGHLYQNMYSSTHLCDIPDSYLRGILWYGGYLEGWAIYTEFISYDYAAELLSEKDLENAANICLLSRHNRGFLLALYALMDLKIHYYGASEADIADLLSAVGIDDGDTIHEIYTYIVEEPTNYMKYYLGYLEILELKKQAQVLWKNDYSDYRFHTFLLEFGPADFDTLSYALHTLEEGA